MTDRNKFQDVKEGFCNSSSVGAYPLPTPDMDGRFRIYFADKELLLTQEESPEGYYTLNGSDSDAIQRAKVVTFIEKYNKVAVRCDDIQSVFDAIAEEFVWVEAAGGVVVNGDDEVVMIRRNGRWDLPKGHREEGEETFECAMREVEEETGVKVACVDKFLCTTIHCYSLYGKWEMKQTTWYQMRSAGEDSLIPQQEEGIVEVKWVTAAEIDTYTKNSFATIKRVFAVFRE